MRTTGRAGVRPTCRAWTCCCRWMARPAGRDACCRAHRWPMAAGPSGSGCATIRRRSAAPMPCAWATGAWMASGRSTTACPIAVATWPWWPSPRRRPCRSAWPYSIAGSGAWSGSPSRWPIYTCKVSSMARCICSTCSAATPTSRRAGRAKATPACCAASTKACPSPAPGTHSAASTTTGGITTSRRGWRSMARPGGCAPRRAGWTQRHGPGATATSSCRRWARRTPPGASVSTTRACTATRTCAPGSAATATC